MLNIPVDPKCKIPLYEQIYQYIKNEIKQNNMKYKTKLPSERSLAAYLLVSRNTVGMAYAQLLSEGYLESYSKRGYFVSEISALDSFVDHTPASIRPFSKPYRSDHTPQKINLQVNPSNILYDFSPFSVDLSHFPYQTWRQLSRNCLSDNTELFLLGDNQGDLSLRKAITQYLHQNRGVNCDENQLIIGAGTDYLLQLLTGILGSAHCIAMENPAYPRACQIFKYSGMKIVPIPLDHFGMSTDTLKKSSCDIAYVTPSHQYPLGIVMPIARRIDLLNWASEKQNRYIIEDDHDSEFRYKGKPIPSLQGIADKDQVIYLGTFSRAIAPAIRVGYMVLPIPLLMKYQQTVSFYASTVSRIDQAILTRFLCEGFFERHLNRMRKVYKTKHDFLLSLLKPLPVKISGEHAGMHFVVQINNGLSEEEFLEKAASFGIKLYGLKQHFLELPSSYIPSFLFGYANLPEKTMESGIQTLANYCL